MIRFHKNLICNAAVIAMSALFYCASPTVAFVPNSFSVPTRYSHPLSLAANTFSKRIQGQQIQVAFTSLKAQGEGTETTSVVSSLSSNDQIALGVVGTKMSLIMLVSEYVLKTTGCGLPAGPYGLIGAAEGLSYLGVTALATFSVYTKVKTGEGLPAGPKGVLGLAEGLAFLAVAVGVVVLALQITNYGYVPNAVPMEGGMCQ
mmetsp:Transcript_21831/g.31880  ORF Transcript_21831/g.31880 Transcript_21831/m.31880 type:complete len:203 (+) Transcript_21831:25-633(+)